MKTKTLFFYSILILFTSYQLNGQVAEQSGVPAEAITLDMSIEEICNCKIKVKLLNKRFWLPSSASLEDLAYLLKSGGRILKTKRPNGFNGSLSPWQKLVANEVLKDLASKFPKTKGKGLNKLLKFLEKTAKWFVQIAEEKE